MAHKRSNTVYIARSSLPVQRVFNDDFMGLKRIFATLTIIYLTE